METEKPHQRLVRIREARGYTKSARQAAFAMQAAGLDVKEVTYTAHESGTKGLSRAVGTYARFYGVTASWLQYGTSQGAPDPFAHGKLEPHPVKLRAAGARLAQRNLAKRRGRQDADDDGDEFDPLVVFDPESPDPINPDAVATISSVSGRIGIPLDAIVQPAHHAGAGGGGISIVNEGVPGKHGMTFAAEAIVDYWRLPQPILSSLTLKHRDVMVLPVEGNSMAPVLLEGDYVFVDTRHQWPSPDGIYVILDDTVDDEFIVKTLRAVDPEEGEEGRWVEIHSENPSYKPRRRRAEDIRVVGRVVRRFSAVF